MNNVSIIGRLCTDAELKQTNSGVAVTSFCLAVDRRYQPKGEEKKADFIDVVAWRSTAEFICKYFQKGSMIGIEGEIQTRTYTDKDGNNRKVTEIVVSGVTFCGKSGSQNGSGSEQSAPSMPENVTFEEIPADDDLPF